MRKILGLIIIFTVPIALLQGMQVSAASFPDVSEDHIYYDAVEYVKQEGIVTGFSDGTFRPENTITRAEFTKIIINALFDPRTGSCTGTYAEEKDLFIDIKLGNQFFEYVCIAKSNNIINGYSDGIFRPNNPITVGEASKIISNAYEFTNVESGPEGEEFRPFIDALSSRNALPYRAYEQNGDMIDTGVFDLSQRLNRAHMVEIIYRIDNNITYKPTAKYINVSLQYQTAVCESNGGDMTPAVGCSNLTNDQCVSLGGEYKDFSCWNREVCDDKPEWQCIF